LSAEHLTNLLFFILVEYDLGNKPELFAYTKRAAYEASKTGSEIPHPNTLAKTGITAMNAKSAAHWGSIYKNEVLPTLRKDALTQTGLCGLFPARLTHPSAVASKLKLALSMVIRMRTHVRNCQWKLLN